MQWNNLFSEGPSVWACKPTGGHCYTGTGVGLYSWKDAELKCHEHGGHLASGHTEAEFTDMGSSECRTERTLACHTLVRLLIIISFSSPELAVLGRRSL